MKINEIVVISGKGGTGKTTLVASLVPFLGDVVIADCDVDAPDLNILFGNTIRDESEFVGLQRAEINYELCTHCSLCHEKCRFDAISEDIKISQIDCEGCGVCEFVCPVDAITMKDSVVGKIFESDTKYGEMVHARLSPGEETSGRLVAEVRKKAKEAAIKNGVDNIVIDGSPGIACNVISSITGVSKAVIVTEPTLSGLHDLEKVYNLTKKFRLPVYVVINKYDLGKEAITKIEEYCKNEGIEIALKIPFEKEMVKTITKKKIPSLEMKEFFNKIGFSEFVEKLK